MSYQNSSFNRFESLGISLPDAFYPENPLDVHDLPVYSRAYIYVIEYIELETSHSEKINIAIGSIGIMSNSKERLEKNQYKIEMENELYKFILDEICKDIISKMISKTEKSVEDRKISIKRCDGLIPMSGVNCIKK